MSFSKTNLELLTLIWLDKFVDSTQENREIQDKLRSIITNVLVFDNCQSCEYYLKYEINDQHEKIILIVSGQFGREIIENIHQLRQIISIFVFCGDKQKHELWAKNYSKIRNVLVQAEDLFNEIEINKKSDEQMLNQSIEIIQNNNQIIDFLLEIPSNIIDKKDFLNICQKYYENNLNQLELIEEFEHLYLPSNALDYFFDQTFIYQILIKSLLTSNIEILYLLRFYLQDLNSQLKTCENISSKIFFSQLMKSDQIEYLHHLNEQTIVQFNSFIITKLNEEQIVNSLQNSSSLNGLHKVLFEIEINENAKIYKEFILFPINTKFRLISIQFHKRIWFVKLNILNENRSTISNINPINFGHYCRNISLLDQSEKLFHLLLKQNRTLNSQCYDGLAKIAQDKGLYELSLQYYLKSLQYVSNEYRFDLLNNIGLIYDYLERFDKALKYYFRSLSLIKCDHDKSIVFNNIGITLAKNKQYEQGIEYLQNSLEIRKNIYQENHIQIGICYSNIANIYLSIQQFNNALEYFHFALKSFQFNEPNLYKAIIYQTIANLYQQTNHTKKSLKFYQDSLDNFKQLKPIDHPNIIFIKQQIQLLKTSK